MIVTREHLQTLRDLRDVALAKYKGCILEVIRCKSKMYYWRRGSAGFPRQVRGAPLACHAPACDIITRSSGRCAIRAGVAS